MSRPRHTLLLRPAAAVLAASAITLAGASVATASAAGADNSTVGVVTARTGLVAHLSPSTHSPRVGKYRRGARLGLDCKVVGTNVGGNRRWYTIDSDASGLIWVSARYVRNVGAAPRTCNPMKGTVTARTTARLNERQGPTVSDRRMGQVAKGATAHTVCWTESASDHHHNWVLTASGRWVAQRYLRENRPLKMCM